jgi:hypothetical protein
MFDIAFTLDHNEHPDFGGLELSLKDFHAIAPTVVGQPPLTQKT